MSVPAHPTTGDAHTGLFVLWSRARPHARRVLEDLANRFRISAVWDVHWTPAMVERNFERFYSDLEVRGVFHVLNKGDGPFLAIVVVDETPLEEIRTTARGDRQVNARFFDAKVRYREWCGELVVHCGETEWETRRDLTMLLGDAAIAGIDRGTGGCGWDGRIIERRGDLAGAHGWDSALEMLLTAATAVDYVVMGDPHLDAETLLAASTPQLLTDRYHTLHTVLDARSRLGLPPAAGGTFSVRVADRRVDLGLRTVGDDFIEADWARGCLDRRALDDQGVPRLRACDALATSAYSMLVHPQANRTDQTARLESMADRLGIPGWSRAELDEPGGLARRVDETLDELGVRRVRPRDPSLPVDLAALCLPSGRWDRVGARLRRRWYLVRQGTVGHVGHGYIVVRDRLLRRAPWLRPLVRRVLGWVR